MVHARELTNTWPEPYGLDGGDVENVTDETGSTRWIIGDPTGNTER